MKYVRAFENLKEDSLAEQLTIHSHFLNHKDDLSEVKKLLPITKLLLEKNKPICPLVPPDLSKYLMFVNTQSVLFGSYIMRFLKHPILND